MSVDELYREVILDHYENPRNKKVLEKFDHHEHGDNPLCGDTIDLYLVFDNDRVKQVAFEGQGCSISQASVSMLTEVLSGKTREEVNEIINRFKGMMLDDKDPDFDNDEFSDLAALEGVKNYPVRIKCALLGWNTMASALENSKG